MLGLAITMVIAPTGQASAQRPWPMHLCPFTMTALPRDHGQHIALGADAGAGGAADAVVRVDVRMLGLRSFGKQLAFFGGFARAGFASSSGS